MQDRHQLRTIFDQDAFLYDKVRPGYPEALFDDVIHYAQLPIDGRILEIGCGTGQATLPMARRGYHILSLELGANLANLARHNLQGYPHIQVLTQAFEDWPVQPAAFDLALSATAFHWIDPAISYQKVAQALKSSGTLALCWHIHVQSTASQGFFEAVQKIYQQVLPAKDQNTKSLPWPEEVPETITAEINQTKLFSQVTVQRYPFTISYDAESYLQLLNTYSDHKALETQQRIRLFNGIADLINTKFNGSITKGYLTLLYLARKKG